MVIVAVDQSDVDVGAREPLGGLQTAEPAADDDDLTLLGEGELDRFGAAISSPE